MDLFQLVSQTVGDSRASLWPAFAPELVLCGTVFVILIIRVFRWGERVDSFLLALAGSTVALYYAYPWQHLSPESAALTRHELFTGMLVYDAFTVYLRAILLFFAILFTVLTKLSGMPDREAGPDFYCLILGATIGMCLMASANHLLMVFLAVEMASVPSYVLAATLKGRQTSSEAALKYSVYGAGAAGIMLYGISLLAGVLNTAHLPTLATQLATNLSAFSAEESMVLALGGLMLMVGLAFKLSAVPFHFWCPDVFEGATAEVNAFLSVASKAAALALLIRVSVGFGIIPQSSGLPETGAEATVVKSNVADSGESDIALFAVDDSVILTETATADESVAVLSNAPGTGAVEELSPVRQYIAMLVAFVAAITCTFGNLAAYAQTNIKRLMAYSTIAHAGYMMMPIPVAMAAASVSPETAQNAIASIAIYMGIYLFMNLGAFAIIAFLRNEMRSEEISDYAGLIRTSPGIVICLSLIMFSLLGIPPLAGFIGKFAVFASLANGYALTGRAYLIVLLIVGGINTAISLFYYLRVVKVMTIDPASESSVPTAVPMVSLQGAYIVAVTIPIAILIINWNTLNEWTQVAAGNLF